MVSYENSPVNPCALAPCTSETSLFSWHNCLQPSWPFWADRFLYTCKICWICLFRVPSILNLLFFLHFLIFSSTCNAAAKALRLLRQAATKARNDRVVNAIRKCKHWLSEMVRQSVWLQANSWPSSTKGTSLCPGDIQALAGPANNDRTPGNNSMPAGWQFHYCPCQGEAQASTDPCFVIHKFLIKLWKSNLEPSSFI